MANEEWPSALAPSIVIMLLQQARSKLDQARESKDPKRMRRFVEEADQQLSALLARLQPRDLPAAKPSA